MTQVSTSNLEAKKCCWFSDRFHPLMTRQHGCRIIGFASVGRCCKSQTGNQEKNGDEQSHERAKWTKFCGAQTGGANAVKHGCVGIWVLKSCSFQDNLQMTGMNVNHRKTFDYPQLKGG